MLDEDVADLVRHLCSRAGMIMEDVSVIALTAEVSDVADARDVTARLRAAAKRIGALAKAADALMD